MDQVTKYDEWTRLFWGQGKFRADFLGVDEVELIGLNDQDCPARWREVGRYAKSWSSEITRGSSENCK